MASFKENLENLFKKEKDFLDENGNVDYIKIKDFADKIDSRLIELLLKNNEIKKKFFSKIKDIYVFNINHFKFFLDENRVNNSYTQYKNRIGLSNGKEFILDQNNIVLDFPFKDCVLEGGQSTEEGGDTYFEYSDKVEKYEEKIAKRSEIFFNQVLAHDEIDRLFDKKALVNWSRFTENNKKDSEPVKEIKRNKAGLIQENLIIKGNNLLALHCLKSEFAGKIKLIYIDPPYNTGTDGFVYNDRFNHSTWLTFMKNRLEISRELLADEGIMMISIGEKEYPYLKVLVDEIFNTTNVISNIVWHNNKKGRQMDKYIKSAYENILVVAKDIDSVVLNDNVTEIDTSNFENDEISSYKKDYPLHNGTADFHINNRPNLAYSIYYNPQKKEAVTIDEKTGSKNNFTIGIPSEEGRGLLKKGYIRIIPKYNESYKNQRVWRWSSGKFNNEYKTELLFDKEKDGYYIYQKKRFFNGTHTKKYTNYIDIDGGNGKKELQALFSEKVFDNPKPERLIAELLKMSSKEGDIVLDYHLGSATTLAVAHKMNRQYIGIEQMDYVKSISVERLIKVVKGEGGGISKDVNWKGGGSFIYCELAKWNEEAKEEIQNAKDLSALIKFFHVLYKKYFLNYNIKIKDFKEKIIKEENFKKLTLAQQKKMFLAMLDLNQMYVNESEITDKKYGISSEDQKLTKDFYSKK